MAAYRHDLRLLLLVATAAQAVASPSWSQLVGPIYRTSSEGTVTVPSLYTASNAGVSFQGWAQVPSSNALRARTLFTVYPSGSSTKPLIAVWIADSRSLCANLTTSAGMETVTSNVAFPTDAWFVFGLAVNVGANRSVHFYTAPMVSVSVQSPNYASVTYGLRGDLLQSSTAVAVVPALSQTTVSVPVYLTALRIIAGATTDDMLNSIANNNPQAYVYQNGNDVSMIAFEWVTSFANISCPSGMVFTAVRAAMYGRPIGVWPNTSPSSLCDSGTSAQDVTASRCLGQSSCVIPHSNDLLLDPCKGYKKWSSVALTCNRPTSSSSMRSVSSSMTSGSPPKTSASSSSPSVKPSSSPPSVRAATSGPTASRSSSSPPSSSPPSFSPSRTLSSASAWYISLQVSQSTLGADLNALRDTLLQDLSTALHASTDRFVLVQFQSQTPFSSQVSFVIVANATDPDGTVLVEAFRSQLQTPGSALRSGALLSAAPAPPVPVQIVAVSLFRCPSGAAALSQDSCTASEQASVTDHSIFQLKLLIWIGAVVAISVVLVIVVCSWVRCRKPRRVPLNVPDDGKSATAVPIEARAPGGPVTFRAESRTGTMTYHPMSMAPSTAPYPPVVPAASTFATYDSRGVQNVHSTAPPALVQYGSYFRQNDLTEVALVPPPPANEWGPIQPQNQQMMDRPDF